MYPCEATSIEYVQSERDARKALNYLHRFDILGFDVETYNKADRDVPAFQPTAGARMRLAQFATPLGEAFVFDLYKVNVEFLTKLFPNQFLCVGHNLKFEFTFLMHELGLYRYGQIFDTMLAEQVTSKGAVTGPGRVWVGLDKVTERRLGLDLPKDEQASAWYKEELSESQIQYAALDAVIVLPLYQLQSEELRTQGQVRVAELEFQDALPACAFMEQTGIYLDEEKWAQVGENIAKEKQEIEHKLWKMLGQQNTLFSGIQTINLNSRDAVKAAFQRIGIDIPLDRDGKVSVGKDNLKSIMHHEEVKLYSKYVTLDKRLTSFGPTWTAAQNKYDKRIHFNLKQLGAETGRMACSNPNMMQVPKENQFRNCFVARDEWVFIDVDYSQCELRILAEYSRDPNLLEAYDKQYDLHRYTASLIFKCPLNKVTDKQRSIAKNLNFGIVYGIGAGKFATQAEIPQSQAEEIMAYYLKHAYPKMGQFLESQARNVLYTMYATTMSGRIRRYAGDLGDKEFKAQVQRNAKNLPIQGTNADITKRAMGLVYRAIVDRGYEHEMKMVLAVHDELIVEAHASRAIEAEILVKDCMLQAEREFLRRVPSVVDSNITRVWCKEPTQEQKEEAQELIEQYI